MRYEIDLSLATLLSDTGFSEAAIPSPTERWGVTV